ncbi:NBS-LRR disease resistance protein [Melia azedarach]|uniref:NBS-LRR disease resistance protein n=1 Tax=Melia azedarach TaxID=155640 RepID=A0ACC1XXW6_MELAZ|nr:NBS-LRR disease resistance protein [Melia azedarach]
MHKISTSLEKLTIGGCDQLHLQFDDGCQWQGLRSLRYLQFFRVENMECLPKWFTDITALQHLQIWDCESLMRLPEEMQLEKLETIRCHHLRERCGNNKGVEWPKVAHMPNIQIDNRWIQLEGHYQGHKLLKTWRSPCVSGIILEA